MRSTSERTSASEHGLSLIAGAAFAAASAAVYGYGFGESSNHHFYLPWVLSVLDPSLYPGDPAAAAVAGAPTFFWHGFALLARLGGPEATALALWTLSRVLAGYLTHRTARLLGCGRWGAFLAVGFVLLSRHLFVSSTLAGDPMFKADLDQTSFSWPVVLAALPLWLARRRTLCFGLLGAAANLNPMVAAIAAACLLIAGPLERREELRALPARAGLFLLAASPVLLWTLWNGSLGDSSIMRACTPQVYLASQWPWERWVEAAAYLLLSAIILVKHPRARDLIPLLGSCLLLWAGAAVLGAVPALRPLLSPQPFRLDVLLSWTAAAAAAALLLPGLADRRYAAFVPALAVCWVLGCLGGGPLLALWGAALLCAEGSPRTQASLGFLGLLYGTLALFFPAFGSVWGLPPTAALTTALFAGLVTAGAVRSASPSAGLFLSPPSRGLMGSPGAAGPGLHAGLLAAAGLVILSPLIGPALLRVPPREPAIPDALAAWARSTPKDTLFIVPPHESGFRLRSRRPVYAEWTDFNAALWDGEAARSWQGRMSELGLDWGRFPERHARDVREWDRALLRRLPHLAPGPFPAWGPADTARLRSLAERAGARYIVAPEAAGLELPKVLRAGGAVAHAAR